MHTLNQHPDGDYDIDTAVIFDEMSLPASALEARKRVAEAVLLAGVAFSRDPEARTNAVTVWYAEGHHVDLAIYRRKQDGSLEHAGPSWTKRDPQEVTDWFKRAVDQKSPSWFPEVEPKQLRRIVRFVKRFCSSRRSWRLPGGMITTTLVVESYQNDRCRDDVALRNTLRVLRNRLAASERVFSPIDPGSELTARPQCAGQVRRLKKRLDEALLRLDVLDTSTCDEASAVEAWNFVFRHPFFAAEEAVDADVTSPLNVTIHVAKSEGGTLREKPYRSSEPPLPKEMWLRFELAHQMKPGDVIRWTVKNVGDEAEESGDLGHTHDTTNLVTWRSTRYHGDHKMRCEVVRNDRVIGTATRTVRVD